MQASLGDGSRGVQLLYDRREQVVPLVIGLRQYLQTLAESIRIDVGDGTLMAAVKGVLGGDACGVLPCPGTGAAATTTTPPTGPTTSTPTPSLELPLPLDGTSSDSGLFDFLSKVLGG